MVVIASSDLSIPSLDTVIRSYAKRTIRRRTTTSTNSVAITVEDVGSPIALNGPVAEGDFEFGKCSKDLALDDWRHFGGRWGVELGVGTARKDWHGRSVRRRAL